MSGEKDTAPGPHQLSDVERAYFESEGETGLEDVILEDEDQPEPAPEGQPEAAPARGEDGKFIKTVPHQTYHMEREEHKKTKEELGRVSSEVQQLREFRARMEERAQWAEEARKAQEQPAPPPDPDTDIFAALKYEREQRAALEAKFNGREQQEQQARQEREFETKVWTHWKQEVDAYAANEPDFIPAAKWLAEQRDKQLQGIALADPRLRDPAVRNSVIDAELKQMVVSAAQQRQSPAKMVHDLAKSWGYTPQAPQPGAKTPQMPDNLRRVEQAQGASRTVGEAAGRSGPSANDFTIDAFAAMPQAEFNAVMATSEGQAAWKRLMGG